MLLDTVRVVLSLAAMGFSTWDLIGRRYDRATYSLVLSLALTAAVQ